MRSTIVATNHSVANSPPLYAASPAVLVIYPSGDCCSWTLVPAELRESTRDFYGRVGQDCAKLVSVPVPIHVSTGYQP